MTRGPKNGLILVLVLICIGWGMVAISPAESKGDEANRIVDAASGGDQIAVKQQWVKRYNGAANLNDEPGCMLVAPSGNVYVVGNSELGSGAPPPLEIAIVKYSTRGNRRWVVHDSDAGTNCYIAAGALDQEENLLILAGCNGSYVTSKYDQTGRKLWMKRYQGKKKHSSFPHPIVVDAAGNVYVSGHSWQSASNTMGIDTVKYSPKGARLWVSNYAVPGNHVDWVSGMAVDQGGDVYIVGTTYRNGDISTRDMLTIKLGPDGRLKWAKRYDGPAHGADEGRAMAIDRDGNVYVTGSSASSGTASDFLTIKYTPAGKRLWVARLVGAGIDFDSANSIALDPKGNVFITGQATVSGTESDFATAKYSPAGKQRWVKYYNGPDNMSDWAEGLAVDAKGNAYVIGTSNGATSILDCVTIKYSAKGQLLWQKRYNGPANDEDRAWSVGLDAAGNAYVSGISKGATTGRDMLTIKYDQ
jgi:uncharacterized delta-60 repeat protein